MNYVKLKQKCNTTYKIGGKPIKIGDMTDLQLEIANKQLSAKYKLSNIKKEQLSAIKYVINYRSEKAINRLLNASINNRINLAIKKATIIDNWIIKNYK